MDFEDIVVKESPGLCRCCLSEGCYKDLGTEYSWMNETEVYADILLECFDISITQHNDGPNGPSRLICEVCITRLRDACNFKKQVQESEKRFIDMVARGEFRPKMVIYQTQVKCEETRGAPAEVTEIEYLDDAMDFVDDTDDLKDESGPSVSEITVSSLPTKGKRGRPRKADGTVDKKAKVARVEDKAKSSKSVVKEKAQEASPSSLSTPKNSSPKWTILRRQIEILLTYSSIMPFRWYRNSKYMCYYCDGMFTDAATFKLHLKSHRDQSDRIKRSLSNGAKLKWDVSEISCKKCTVKFESFDDFVNHISKEHKLKFDKELFQKQCLMFCLSDNGMRCIECGEYFKFFASLLRHVSEYHNKSVHYTCDYCSKSFAYKYAIKAHVENVHLHLPKKCNYCSEMFSSRDMIKHCEEIHKTAKFKCPKCPEVLTSNYFRKWHLMRVHDVRKDFFACDECNRFFSTKGMLLRHKSLIHRKERLAACDVCGLNFFDAYALKRHMICHDDTKGRPFKCKECKKSYPRLKSLRAHERAKHLIKM